MKILLYTLALISAFFVFADQDIVDAKQVDGFKAKPYIYSGSEFVWGDYIESTDRQSAISSALAVSVSSVTTYIESLSSVTGSTCGDVEFIYTVKKGTTSETKISMGYIRTTKRISCSTGQESEKVFESWGFTAQVSSIYSTSTYICPPDSHPLYTEKVGQNSCAMPEIDPDAKCDEFGNNSMLPPKDGVGIPGQTACYTNPATGKSCQYSQGHDSFTATGKDCDGDENDYGDKPTPKPPQDGNDDNCYDFGSLGGVLICDVDPNQGCNALLINGQTQYQCPPGCGSMDGVYFCAYDDKDGDGKADDKNGNGVPDKDETCVNGRCTPNPDSNETPNPDAPDMTQTNNKLDGIKGELGFVGGKLDKTNQVLDGINSGIQGLKKEQAKSNGLLTDVEKNTKLTAGNTDAIAGNTKGILEALQPSKIPSSFNPDSSSSFYDSSYENGFEGVWEEKSLAFKQTETFLFLEQFKFNASGSAPDTQMCFNLGGSMDFGCAELPTPSPQLLAIIRVFILITAAFLCRALIFGG